MGKAASDETESQTNGLRDFYSVGMPWGLKRFCETGALHFVTWSCRDRLALLDSADRRDLLLKVLEQMRNRYRFVVAGYVVMPEHVHVLVSEPWIGNVSSAICAIKLGFTKRVLSENPHLWQNRPEVGHPGRHFWMKRFYDFNVYSEPKIAEKLHYMHQNPVTRGLVVRPEDWKWSSFNFYACGESGIVKVNDWSWWEVKIKRNASDEFNIPTSGKSGQKWGIHLLIVFC
ncbi:MAG TPA: transposase [Candidatus Eisenbacteria bacterium]|nr:transposase [Candidatus Eisenbacteria bacterium]